MSANQTQKSITVSIFTSEPGATRRLFRKIVLSHLCGPHQVYQQSDLRVVYIGYHNSWIKDRDRKSGIAIVSRDCRRKIGIAIASPVMSCLMTDCAIRLV